MICNARLHKTITTIHLRIFANITFDECAGDDKL